MRRRDFFGAIAVIGASMAARPQPTSALVAAKAAKPTALQIRLGGLLTKCRPIACSWEKSPSGRDRYTVRYRTGLGGSISLPFSIDALMPVSVRVEAPVYDSKGKLLNLIRRQDGHLDIVVEYV